MDRESAKEEARKYLPQYLIQTGRPTKEKFLCLCHNEKTPSMSYYKNENQCHCFGCGASIDIFDIVGIDYGLTEYKDKLEKACELFGIEIDKGSSTNNSYFLNGTTKKNKKTKADVERITETEKENYMEYYMKCKSHIGETSYLKDRGISKETASKFLIGYDDHYKVNNNHEWKAIIIPTGESSFIARNTDKEAEKTSRFRKKGESLLFNKEALKEQDKPIVIVEGEIDALSIIEVGGVALALGSTANKGKLIEAVKEVVPAQPLILALDNDEAGRTCSAELEKELAKLGITFYRTNLYGDYKDANEALVQDRESLKENVANIIHLMEKEKEAVREEYEKNSACYHLQNFIDSIADSVNTPPIPTGFNKLDKLLEGGLYEGLYVFGAISSLGKTTFVLQMADQLAKQEVDVLIFSLEMARNELIAKSISRHTLLEVMRKKGDMRHAKTNRGITTGARYQYYSQEEKDIIKRSIENYQSYSNHIYITEGVGELNAEGVRAGIEKHISITGRKPIVIVDYMQILAPYDVRYSDKQNVDKSVLELKRASRDFKIPIIAISSLNRQNYNEEVSMQGFKESGGIEYGVDALFGLQLKGVGEKGFNANEAKSKSPREIELLILKNRNGATGKKVAYTYYPMFNYFKEE